MMNPFIQNQVKQAERTLKLSDVQAGALSNMTKTTARRILRDQGFSDQYINKLEGIAK